MKKTQNETKISAENAEKIFLQIKEAFGLNVKEAKVRKIILDIKGNKAETTEEYDSVADIIDLIKDGRVEFNKEKTVIKFNLSKPISQKDGTKFGCFEIGVFTRNKQKQVKIPLSELNPASLKDEELDTLLQVMTGVSDPDIFGEMNLPEFNMLRSISILFFS
ncbi:MAG: hypothetical protein MIO92_10300 [Methanosarcinaceae archaeon]|nr:hypothetical protein [Methanosarcinaceae archaeon]